MSSHSVVQLTSFEGAEVVLFRRRRPEAELEYCDHCFTSTDDVFPSRKVVRSSSSTSGAMLGQYHVLPIIETSI